jgi:cellulose synthase/poly-beta-1,6-N-acetylglucosamine synthase-like glycosyltransferase
MTIGIPHPRPAFEPAFPRRDALRVIAIVPAYNEEEGIGATLRSLLAQDTPFDEIIVVDDGSADRTGRIARAYGVTVLRPESNLGSKAKAQNHALAHILARPRAEHPDLVVPVDADTVLARDCLTHIQKPFDDPQVAIAGGCVLARHSHTVVERGRLIEYLTGFHAHRQVQSAFDSPLVCSGCCSALRLSHLEEFGGFPERTMAVDLDYTWSQQMTGRRAVHVPEAVAYVAEPLNLKSLREQLSRHKHGYFQNLRIHWRPMQRSKPMLALWVNLSLISILIGPLALGLPILWLLGGNVSPQLAWSAIGADLAVLGVPLVMGTARRRLNPLTVLLSIPSFYVLKVLNFWYDLKCGLIELVLVPRELAQGRRHYEKARTEGATYLAQVQAQAVPVPVAATVPAPVKVPAGAQPEIPAQAAGHDLDWSLDRWREQPSTLAAQPQPPVAPEVPEAPDAPVVVQPESPALSCAGYELDWSVDRWREYLSTEPVAAESSQPPADPVVDQPEILDRNPAGYDLDWSLDRWREYLSTDAVAVEPSQPPADPVVDQPEMPTQNPAGYDLGWSLDQWREYLSTDPVAAEPTHRPADPVADQPEAPVQSSVDYDLDWSVERWLEYLRSAA